MAKKAPHKTLYIRAAQDIADVVEDMAQEENRTVTNMVETILRRYLEDIGKLPKELALSSLITVRASEATEASVPALVSAYV